MNERAGPTPPQSLALLLRHLFFKQPGRGGGPGGGPCAPLPCPTLLSVGYTAFSVICSAGNEDEAVSQVAALVASPQLRATVGTAGREEVSLWDWRAATQHLLQVQYPLAMALAAQQYGRALGRATQQYPPTGTAGGAAGTPAVAA